MNNTIKFLQEELKEKNVEVDIYKELISKKQEEIELYVTKRENLRISHSGLFKINTADDVTPKCNEYCSIF
jgi:hypothetical protein